VNVTFAVVAPVDVAVTEVGAPGAVVGDVVVIKLDGLDGLDVFEKSCYCQYNNTDYICTHITDNFNEN
jgi:hypothetical protein